MNRIFGLIKKPIDLFNRLSLKKKIIVVVLIVLVLVVLNQTVFKSKESGYVTEAAELATVTQTVSETGNVDSGAAIDVTTPATGFVSEVFIENGQVVSEGDVLFTITSTATVQEQQTAYSTYLAASSSLKSANSTLNTLKSNMFDAWKLYYDRATSSLFEEDDGTPKEDARQAVEFNTAKEDWLAAEALVIDQETAIAQGQADASSKWLLYQATQNADVKATTDGTIANLSITEGSDVLAGSNILILVPPVGSQVVHIEINEIDIPKIEPGQKAEVEIDAIDDEVFDGKVIRVDSVGTNTQGVITYNVYVRLGKSDPRIKSEMTANVEIATKTIKNTLSVPNSAIKLFEGGRAVQILKNGEPEYIPVKIGVRGNERTQILEGIKEGQQIIVGAKNELIQRDSPFGF